MSKGKYKCSLSAEMLEKAMKELNEDPNTRHIEIQTLRERLEKVPGYKGRTDDEFLLRFLRCKKFDQERAFTQVITYYKMRNEHTDIYENLTPQRTRYLLEAGVVGVLKDRAPDGSRVVLCRPGKWDPNSGPVGDMFGNNFMTFSKLIEEEETQVCGMTVVLDLKGITMQHAKQMSPINARKMTSLLQEAFPARFKGIHYLNEPTFFDVVFAIVKQFMKEKLLKRIHLHGDKWEKLHETFPPEMLPQEYGGKLPPFNNDEWKEKMLACEAQFQAENKFGLLDMTIRSKENKKQDALGGMAGSFKKLNVD